MVEIEECERMEKFEERERGLVRNPRTYPKTKCFFIFLKHEILNEQKNTRNKF